MTTMIHVELDAVCLLLLGAIAWQSQRSVNQQMRRVLFRCLVYGVIVQLALDILWRLVEGRVFPGAAWINRAVNALFLSVGVVLGCVWLLYVLETLGTKITRRLQAAAMLPGFAFTVFNLLSVWTGWCFTVSEDNVYAHGEWFWVQMIGAYGMLAVSFVYILARMLAADGRGKRRAALRLLAFYIIPVAGAALSAFYTGMPGAWTCASISLVLMYIDQQDSEIVRDSLTGLNNRKTLPGTFAEYARQSAPGNILYLFMIDVDRFKQINDTLGHPVGDQALVVTARVLSRAMAGQRGYIARYGGDEFLIMAFFSDGDAAMAFRRDLDRRFEACRAEQALPYSLAVSAGMAPYAAGVELEEIIRQADADLYADKQRRRRE